MRIVHLSWEYPPVVYGGLGRHVHALAEAQAALGHDVVVISQHQDGASVDEVRNGVRIVRVPPGPPQLPMSELLPWVLGFGHSVSLAGARLAREWQPDVVHAHDWLVAHPGVTLGALHDVPLVVTMHATEAGRHQGWLPGELNRAIHGVEWWLAQEARQVITCSSHMQWEVRHLFELPADKTAVIPNGIHLERWSVDPAAVRHERERFAGSGPLLLFTGRLEREKGTHTLLEAMPELARQLAGCRLVVVGRGSQEAELQALAADLGIDGTVDFVGWLPDDELPALAAAADVAVVPSIYEPFGIVALEAVAAGTPLVVADTGGLRELVGHGVTGVHFTPGDVPGLVDAVTSLARNEVLARRMVHDGRLVLADRYAWTSVADRTVAVYQRALAEHTVAGRVRRPHLARLAVEDTNLLTGEPRRP